MAGKIRAAIAGYGNLGKGVEAALKQNKDFKLVTIFTRRDMEGKKFTHISKAPLFKKKIDVLILCGGSATDLPVQGPEFAKMFNTVDSFDTHANIPKYFAKLDSISRKARKISVISTGWDPGLFSLNRLLANCVLPKGVDYTFWGKGVSQGHSDAIRRVEGVLNGKQYTCPIPSAIAKVRSGKNPKLSTRQKHLRVCYVVAKPGADLKKIEKTIKTMPNYFSDYDTTVHFISEEKFNREHKGLPHGGFVIRTGVAGTGTKHIVEFSLKLDSNPDFTGSVMVAYARAAARLSKAGETGCRTVFDIPYAILSAKSGAELRKELL